MIHYNLKCENNHAFSSWFDSLEAFDKLEKANMLSCPSCGSDEIKRAIMSPQVSPSRTKQAVSLTKPASEIEKKISDARKKIETESEDVGKNFASEARAMHEGDSPIRSIYGEAKIKDAKSLIDDGIPVIPLPWTKRQTN
tara:strand:- start:7777 stop:8196 length:420 start_codon:yes stop_codon:yes gene_type:complete